MIEIEIKKTQSITNEQLGKYYAEFLLDVDNAESFYQDLAYAIDRNIPDNITDFCSVVEEVAELSWDDIAEILEFAAQNLRKRVDK